MVFADDMPDNETANNSLKEAVYIRSNIGNSFQGFDKDAEEIAIINQNGAAKYYYPVKTGWEKDEFISKIKDTFTISLAEELIQNSNDFLIII